jgi:hypothetical protein
LGRGRCLLAQCTASPSILSRVSRACAFIAWCAATETTTQST